MIFRWSIAALVRSNEGFKPENNGVMPHMLHQPPVGLERAVHASRARKHDSLPVCRGRYGVAARGFQRASPLPRRLDMVASLATAPTARNIAAMASRDHPPLEITPQVLLKAYACGIFPMAEAADDPQLYWIEPQVRGVLPLDAVYVPRRLARTIRQGRHEVRIDSDFEGVIEGCAASRPDRRSTWINSQIRGLYRDLFRLGHCHTVEVWKQGRLVGGLYGVALGGAFFGESMFSYERDASKIALVYLCARLLRGGFVLLDTQFVTEHLRQFGTVEVDKNAFQTMLDEALEVSAAFSRLERNVTPEQVLAILDDPRPDCFSESRPE